MRAHHRTLAETLDSYVADVEAGISELDTASLVGLLDGLTSFLANDLIPHARGEETSLYPALDSIIRERGRPTATMSVDHEFIADYVRQINESARRLRSAGERDRAVLALQLARQVIQLQGLFAVHLTKEERVYLPLVEQELSAEQQEALLAALHEQAEDATAPGAASSSDELEVRHLPPAQRHQIIFERFNALTPGASFVLINDHDPKPLYYQLTAEYAGDLTWQYLEEGPRVWRVRMGKAS